MNHGISTPTPTIDRFFMLQAVVCGEGGETSSPPYLFRGKGTAQDLELFYYPKVALNTPSFLPFLLARRLSPFLKPWIRVRITLRVQGSSCIFLAILLGRLFSLWYRAVFMARGRLMYQNDERMRNEKDVDYTNYCSRPDNGWQFISGRGL